MIFAAAAQDIRNVMLRLSDGRLLSRLLLAIVSGIVVFQAEHLLRGEMMPTLVRSGLSNALTIDHPLWGRVGEVQAVEVRVERSKGRRVKLYLDSEFTKNFGVERSQPLPKTITAEDGGQVLTFDAPLESNLTVNLALRPLVWGRSEVQLRSDVPGIMMAVTTISELILP